MSAPGNRDDGIPTGVGVADLKVENDVQGELKLRPAALDTLAHMARMGGEIEFSWEGLKPASREMIADMINMELVKEVEYGDAHRTVRRTLRMTDKGRNVHDTHSKRKIVAGSVKSILA